MLDEIRESTTRTATCTCGQLALTLVGEPGMVVLCHCDACQRRTGSSHQVAAWFGDAQLECRSGDFKIFERVGDGGTELQFEFCGECGSTVSWTMAGMPGARAIAAGCFADPTLPAPQTELFTSRRHHWMLALEGVAQFDTQPSEGSPSGAQTSE